MPQGATSGDREQQKHDNNVSRRQSGLEPRPEDREEKDERPGRRGAAPDGDSREDGGK